MDCEPVGPWDPATDCAWCGHPLGHWPPHRRSDPIVERPWGRYAEPCWLERMPVLGDAPRPPTPLHPTPDSYRRMKIAYDRINQAHHWRPR